MGGKGKRRAKDESINGGGDESNSSSGEANVGAVVSPDTPKKKDYVKRKVSIYKI